MPDSTFTIRGAFPPATLDDWKAKAAKDLRGASIDSLSSTLRGGLRIEPLHAPGPSVEARTGLPGLFPFVRGTAPVGQPWVPCQEHDDPRMGVCAEAIGADLARGVEAIWLRVGLDDGTRVLTAGDLALVLSKVDLATTPVFLEPGIDAFGVGAAHLAIADARGVARDALRGGLGIDPLGSLGRVGTLPAGTVHAYRELVELGVWSARHAPRLRAVLASSAPYHDAGATVVQEIAWTCATALDYLRALVEQGKLRPDDAARQVVLAFSIGNDFFAEIAKLRAARWIFAKIVRAAGGGEAVPWVHARSSAMTTTARDPWVNVLRGTAQTCAAAIGGADSIACAPFDRALGASDAFARRLARNTHAVLRDEAHVHEVADPAGGSYYLEKLTEQLARAAWAELRHVEAEGGMHKALGSGRVRRELDAAGVAFHAEVARRKAGIVGVSEFPLLDEAPVTRAIVDFREVEGELGNSFGDADPNARIDALREVARCADEPVELGKLAEAAIGAMGIGVDLVHLAASFRDGRPQLHAEPLVRRRLAARWERLRDLGDARKGAHGKRLQALLLCFGPLAEHNGRAQWTANLLAAGGFEPVQSAPLETIDDAAKVRAETPHDFLVLCAADARYPALVPDLVARLKSLGDRTVCLAGRPGEQEQAYRTSGVHAFLHVGADVLSLLEDLQRVVESE